jgi:hypothetical protein
MEKWNFKQTGNEVGFSKNSKGKKIWFAIAEAFVRLKISDPLNESKDNHLHYTRRW